MFLVSNLKTLHLALGCEDLLPFLLKIVSFTFYMEVPMTHFQLIFYVRYKV